ncbi:hypothetical protein GCM10010174_10940 [Kutzneria viridogrisea]|uniref:RNA polymerase sigma factor (Sigma-70 family) n=1 Tax=Kutzneria viridogrisea TaxID=47990 RepID=A0ABR6BIP5_9PSEU|nr:RNA polymerase sigma factor (sigma-70 family) [Kutzneria viridogrisea]
MATAPLDVPGPSDAELIDSVRSGDTQAYGSLYERHVSAAYNLARQLTRSTAEADDLVAEAFAKVLDTLRAGRGPDTAFRAYLLTALRHTAYDKTRRDRKLELAEDVSTVASPESVSVPFSDTAVSGLERSLAAKAFARLPERWQAVLWHTEIEGQSPAEVAPLLGLTANGVSALAYRAREGLRQAYLQVHLAESSADRCRATVDRLGAWTRGGLSKRETAQVEAHLDECEQCRALAAELADVNGALRALVAPLVLGVGAAGYLAAIGAGTAKAATVVAAGSAAGAGGAAGAASGLPRQLMGVAASSAALAAAIAVALTSGQASPPPAAAQPAPPPVVSTAPAPTQPPPTQSVPPVPPTTPPTTPTTTTTTTTTAPPAPPTSTPPPAPAKAALVPSVPTTPINLVPGGPAVELPVTVRNSGDGPSDPVTAALNLPEGVTAQLTKTSRAQGMAPPRMLSLEPVAAQEVRCTGGTGTISCTTTTGLAPGQSVTFSFQLKASPDAKGGQITGTISAGSAVSISLGTVQVQVSQVDELDLSASVWRHDFWLPRLDVLVTNRSSHAGTVTLTLDAPREGWLFTFAPCHQTGLEIVCEFELAQGESKRLSAWVFRWWGREDVVQVSASLGTAHKVLDVPVDCDPGGITPPSPPAPPVPPTPTHGPTVTPGPTSPPGPTHTPGPTTTAVPPTPSSPPAPPVPPTSTPPRTTAPSTHTTKPTPTPTTTPTPSPSRTPTPRERDPWCVPLLNPFWPFC